MQNLLDSTYKGLLKTRRDQAVKDVEELRVKEQKGLLTKEEIAALRELEKRRNKLNDELEASLDKDYKIKQSAIESGKALKEQDEALKLRTQLGRELTEVEKVNLEFGKFATAEQLEYAAAIDEVNAKIQEQVEKQQRLTEGLNIAREAMSLINELQDEKINRAKEVANAEIAEIDRVLNHNLESLRQEFKFRKASDKQKKKMEKEFLDEAESQRQVAKDQANKEMAKAFKVKQAMDASQVIMSTSVAVMKTLSEGRGLFSTPLAMAVAAMGAAQVAMIKKQKPPKMEMGGLVGGKRHSEGGTIIEAERGEFVMNRNATESIGIENLNRMNRGSSSGIGTSIVINNPILGKDTVEDEIIPQIKEALRRGGDIGI